MKKILRIPLLLVALLLTSIPISAHDFEVDGIYYNITDSTALTVKVTYSGSSIDAVANEYTGSVIIPETVTNSGTTYSVTSIGSCAFDGCTGLTSVTIPNSVTSIGYYAFDGCTGLTSVTIPNSVTSIGFDAFRDCTSLTSVTIPNSVTSIGDKAFCNCTGLTTVNFNATNCTTMGSRSNSRSPVFSGCTALTTLNIGDNVTNIPSYAFEDCDGLTSVTIGTSVTSIGSYAFDGCTGLTSVTIPNSVTTIGGSAFYGCTGLTSVTIPNSVTSIGSCAFDGCTGLTSVTIPNSVTSIGFDAFDGCTGLTSVTIPNSVTTIGGSAFSYCTGLTEVIVDGGNLYYDSRDNCNAIIETSSNTLITGCKNTIIPNSVTSIGSSAFDGCSGLTEVTIPNSVTSIGNSAFSYCSGLTSVIIPNSVTSIGHYAFEVCDGLTSVTIGNSVTSIGYYAFLGCTGLTSVIIPNSVTTIGARAFSYCSGLTSVIIPNSVTTIGDDAFYSCSGLTSVTIGNSVTTIGARAFYYCDGLTTVTSKCNTPPTTGDYPFSDYNATLYVPYGSLETYRSAEYWSRFSKIVECGLVDGLKYSKISDTEVKVIGMTESVNNIAIPSTITINNDTYSVTEIADSAFINCSDLASITIPNTVIKIGLRAFERCTGLTSIEIPNSVTSIGNNAFRNCTGLTTVNFNATNCTTMGSSSSPGFSGCTALTTLNIGDNVTNIPTYAFKGCSSLTSIAIPNSVTSIGNYAFSGCTSLTTVNFNATNCTTMGSSSSPVFSGCTALTTLNIGDNVTNIPTYAFKGCTGLTSVAIPNSETSIGYQAFWGCDKLINNSVTTTQTTATINLTSPTQYNLGLYYNNIDKMQAENGVVKFTGLKPGYTNSNYDLALIVNGIYCPIKDLSFTTKSFHAYISGSATTTSVSAIGTYTEGDVTILGKGINYGSSVTNYDGNNTITVNNLDPNRSYTIYYAVKTQEGGVYSTSKSFTTAALTWINGEFTATSTTSARLSVETSCDATAGTGFEWKRYDAPESLAPSKAPCPVVEGMLVGSLRNLNPDVYYKCRPYYTSSSGNTYYGEWITFFTGDANVYFEPEVRTFSERSVVNNSVTVKGYALAGTDDISEQGFEYWKIGSITPSSTDTRMTVKASGISMTATLADLEYNSTYRYRAYVKTAQGTFYGAEEEFSTGEDPAGIEYIEVDDSDSFDVMLRENPATATAWVKVAGASATEAEYYILTTNGGVVANGFIPADGEYQPIELNIANGLYLITVTDGTNIKTLRLIVR